MSINLYDPGLTSNDLLARLIAEQQVMKNQIIAPNALSGSLFRSREQFALQCAPTPGDQIKDQNGQGDHQ